jgi:hypothetical protein
LLTARSGDIGGLLALASANEFTYLCVLAIVALLGPGVVSLDSHAFGPGGRFRESSTRDAPGSERVPSSAG